MKMQLDGQKTLHLSLNCSLPSFLPLWPSFTSFYNPRVVFVYFLSVGLLVVSMHEQRGMREEGKRETEGNKCNIFDSFPLLPFLSFALSIYPPPRGQQLHRFRRHKKVFLGLTFICCGRAGWERKYREDRERLHFLSFLSGSLTFPFVVSLFVVLAVSCLCLSRSLHLSCWQS